MISRFAAFAIVALGIVVSTCAQPSPVVLTSPDHQLEMTFSIQPAPGASGNQGRLTYAVKFHGKPVVEDSGLSLEIEDQPTLGPNVAIAGVEAGHGIDDYTLQTGKTSRVHDAYNSVSLHVSESGDLPRTMTVEARAYNDGIAFRYVVPNQESLKELRLHQEDTEFRLATDALDWALTLPNYRSSYESEYVHLPTTAFSAQGGVPSHVLIGLPLLMHEPGLAWIALLEAGIEHNSSLYVTNPSGGWDGHWFVSRLSPGFENPDLVLSASLPHFGAWRVLMIADDPGRFIESNLVDDLNPPSRLHDTTWIHPGKVAWDWWSGSLDPEGKPAFTTANMKYYLISRPAPVSGSCKWMPDGSQVAILRV